MHAQYIHKHTVGLKNNVIEIGRRVTNKNYVLEVPSRIGMCLKLPKTPSR